MSIIVQSFDWSIQNLAQQRPYQLKSIDIVNNERAKNIETRWNFFIFEENCKIKGYVLIIELEGLFGEDSKEILLKEKPIKLICQNKLQTLIIAKK